MGIVLLCDAFHWLEQKLKGVSPHQLCSNNFRSNNLSVCNVFANISCFTKSLQKHFLFDLYFLLSHWVSLQDAYLHLLAGITAKRILIVKFKFRYLQR